MMHTSSGIERRFAALPADRLVMAEAAFPHEVCPGPREQEPAGLDRECLRESRAL